MAASPSYHYDVLVLDSGVGGLSVVESVVAANDKVRVTYVADDAYYPYGLMSEQSLKQRLIELTGEMLEHCQPALVILACNTVSTLLLPELRARFSVPFVGVVPAVKPAALASKSRHIGVLATPATVERHYLDRLINDFAVDCRVDRIGSSELVHQAECLLMKGTLDHEVLRQELQPFVESPEMDSVVLGCTHFPLMRDALAELLPHVSLVDSGEAIARRVNMLLDGISPLEGGADHHEIYFSSKVPESDAFRKALAKIGLANAELKRVGV